jgi:hypothetical protein
MRLSTHGLLTQKTEFHPESSDPVACSFEFSF